MVAKAGAARPSCTAQPSTPLFFWSLLPFLHHNTGNRHSSSASTATRKQRQFLTRRQPDCQLTFRARSAPETAIVTAPASETCDLASAGAEEHKVRQSDTSATSVHSNSTSSLDSWQSFEQQTTSFSRPTLPQPSSLPSALRVDVPPSPGVSLTDRIRATATWGDLSALVSRELKQLQNHHVAAALEQLAHLLIKSQQQLSQAQQQEEVQLLHQHRQYASTSSASTDDNHNHAARLSVSDHNSYSSVPQSTTTGKLPSAPQSREAAHATAAAAEPSPVPSPTTSTSATLTSTQQNGGTAQSSAPSSPYYLHPPLPPSFPPGAAPLLRKLLSLTAVRRDTYDISCICTTLHALSLLKYNQPEVTNLLLEASLYQMSSLSHCVTLIVSLARLQHLPSADWRRAYYRAVVSANSEAQPAQLSDSLLALGKLRQLGCPVSVDFIDQLLTECMLQLQQFSLSQLICVLQANQLLQVPVKPETLAVLYSVIQRRLAASLASQQDDSWANPPGYSQAPWAADDAASYQQRPKLTDPPLTANQLCTLLEAASHLHSSTAQQAHSNTPPKLKATSRSSVVAQQASKLVSAAMDATEQVLPELQAQQLAQLLRSFAKMGARPSPQLTEALLVHTSKCLKGATPGYVATVLESAPCLGIHPHKSWLQEFATAAELHLWQMTAQQLASCVYGLAQQQYSLGSRFVRKLSEASRARLAELACDGTATAQLLLAFRQLDVTPPPEWQQQLMSETQGRLAGSFSSDSLATTGCILTSWGAATDTYWATCFLASAKQCMLEGQVSPAVLLLLLSTAAKLQVRPDAAWCQAAIQCAASLLGQFQAEQCGLLLVTLRQVGARPDQQWLARFAIASCSATARLSAGACVLLLQGLVAYKVSLPKPYWKGLLVTSQHLVRLFTPSQLASCGSCIAQLWQYHCRGAKPLKLQKKQPASRSTASTAHGRIRLRNKQPPARDAARKGQLPASWTKAYLARVKDLLPSLTPAQLAACIGAVQQLGIQPPRPWLAALLPAVSAVQQQLSASEQAVLASGISCWATGLQRQLPPHLRRQSAASVASSSAGQSQQDVRLQERQQAPARGSQHRKRRHELVALTSAGTPAKDQQLHPNRRMQAAASGENSGSRSSSGWRPALPPPVTSKKPAKHKRSENKPSTSTKARGAPQIASQQQKLQESYASVSPPALQPGTSNQAAVQTELDNCNVQTHSTSNSDVEEPVPAPVPVVSTPPASCASNRMHSAHATPEAQATAASENQGTAGQNSLQTPHAVTQHAVHANGHTHCQNSSVPSSGRLHSSLAQSARAMVSDSSAAHLQASSESSRFRGSDAGASAVSDGSSSSDDESLLSDQVWPLVVNGSRNLSGFQLDTRQDIDTLTSMMGTTNGKEALVGALSATVARNGLNGHSASSAGQLAGFNSSR